jgi:hypothetical protein
VASSKANKKLRADYESKEFADGTIRPRQYKYGVIYAPCLKSGENISITLTEMETKERLTFKFAKNGPEYFKPEKQKQEQSNEIER